MHKHTDLHVFTYTDNTCMANTMKKANTGRRDTANNEMCEELISRMTPTENGLMRRRQLFHSSNV